MKTVTVAFQLRVPSKMRVEEIDQFLLQAVGKQAQTYSLGIDRENYGAHVRLYKGRAEVFAP